ncbi:YceI family protein [Luteimicrobium subarcticum]|uniref:Polyisoprenoid-binding protein YceI n=1 Tax=Luteimicrobium subarcticum TaxID=620910 RepID=A0A2M8WVS1_9MICO|nr:YceI family protein [Luteimicrobium subarcticum]PJI95021.1 polyisoprenoid-binding protein YceI [Luteimicrobium subarcticum]
MTTTALPTGVVPGTYTIDPAHSTASFTVRHAGISKVRGTVAITSGTVTVGDSFEVSSVTAELDAKSISTGDANRDGHLQSADFFTVEQNPTWSFVSKSVKGAGEEFVVTGDLTINGVTNEVELDTEFTGAAVDAFGNERAAFEAHLEISRKEFGVSWNAALEAGGVLVSDKVKIDLDLSTIKG